MYDGDVKAVKDRLQEGAFINWQNSVSDLSLIFLFQSEVLHLLMTCISGHSDVASLKIPPGTKFYNLFISNVQLGSVLDNLLCLCILLQFKPVIITINNQWTDVQSMMFHPSSLTIVICR